MKVQHHIVQIRCPVHHVLAIALFAYIGWHLIENIMILVTWFAS